MEITPRAADRTPFPYYELPLSASSTMVWGQAPEAPDQLLAHVVLSDTERSKLSQLRAPSRLREWLFTRYLLQQQLPQTRIEYLPAGKPYLHPPTHQLSISHHKTLVGVALSRSETIGIDIESPNPKLAYLAPRFVHTDERPFIDHTDLVHLCLLWAAKEASYKALGLPGTDFREHLRLASSLASPSGSFVLRVERPGHRTELVLHHRPIGSAYLVWTEAPTPHVIL